jgi:hypothetical protein
MRTRTQRYRDEMRPEITPHQMARLEAARLRDGSSNGSRDLALIDLMIFEGMGAADLARLSWDDFDPGALVTYARRFALAWSHFHRGESDSVFGLSALGIESAVRRRLEQAWPRGSCLRVSDLTHRLDPGHGVEFTEDEALRSGSEEDVIVEAERRRWWRHRMIEAACAPRRAWSNQIPPHFVRHVRKARDEWWRCGGPFFRDRLPVMGEPRFQGDVS